MKKILVVPPAFAPVFMTMLVAVLGMALLAISAPAQAQQANAPAAGNAENGKKLWVKDNCYSCHGYEGHGGAGARLTPKPIALAGFIAIVRHPPASTMPTFSAKVIPDSDLRDMWAYLNSVPPPPPVKDIPLLNQ